jgi:hypothetical protein
MGRSHEEGYVMKKLSVILGALAALGLALAASIPQLVNSQIQTQPQVQTQTIQTAPPSVNRTQLQMEIALLRVMNEMGLNRDQLTSLKEIVSQLQISRQAVLQAQQELRDFLVRYQGGREDFAQAVKPYDEKIAQAQATFRGHLQTTVEKAKDLLTLRQAEILHEFVQRHMSRHLRYAPMDRAQPLQLRMPPADPQTPLELRIEVRTQAQKNIFDRLKERMGKWLDRNEVDLDAEIFERLKLHEEHETLMDHPTGMDHRPPSVIFRCERRLDSLPYSLMCIRPRPYVLERSFMERFLMEHLDVLGKVLDERLQQMGTSM